MCVCVLFIFFPLAVKGLWLHCFWQPLPSGVQASKLAHAHLLVLSQIERGRAVRDNVISACGCSSVKGSLRSPADRTEQQGGQ